MTVKTEEKENKQLAPAGERLTGGQLTRLKPANFAELEHMAQVLGKSDIVPKELIGKPANILLVLMFGNEIGISAAQALQNVMVVNGRPSLWGDAVMGLVLASEVYEDSKDAFDEKTMTATFHAKRKGKDWLVRSFSQADAVKANLWTKQGPWQQFPKRMLFHRARSWALRDAFADVLKGLRYYEEERDIINLEAEPGQGGKTYAMPPMQDPKAIESAPATASTATEAPKAEAKPAEAANKPNPESVKSEKGQRDGDFAVFKPESVSKAMLGKTEVRVIRGVGHEHKYYTEDMRVADYTTEAARDGAEVKTFYDTVAGKRWISLIERTAKA